MSESIYFLKLSIKPRNIVIASHTIDNHFSAIVVDTERVPLPVAQYLFV
jgi:hypothetical protein